MSRYWFISAPLPGHLDWGGLIKTAQVLRARGHDVLWVSEAPIAPHVERAGIPFAAVPESGWNWPPPPMPDPRSLPPREAIMLRYRRALDTWMKEDRVLPAVDAMRELADRISPPDVIVTDPFLTASALLAELLDVSLVVGGWPAGPPIDEDHLLYVQRELGRDGAARVERLCAHYSLQGINFGGGAAPSMQSPLLHISYFSAYWHQGESFLPQTQFVGGAVTPPSGDPPDWLSDLPDDLPLGLVTLGTVFTGDLDFFAWGAHALAANGIVPLVVIGNNPIEPEAKAALIRKLPGGTRLLAWVDFDHVFPRLSVILHHGGMGTTHAAVVHGIPQIIVPHAADQRGQARRARQAKVGLELTHQNIKQGDLPTAVRAITGTAFVQEAVHSLAQSFTELGGPQRAADHIEAVK